MRAGYGNTLSLRLGATDLFAPPTGAPAETWDAFRAEFPDADGARVSVSGPLLHVQIERSMGSPGERVALIGVIAGTFHAEPEVTPMTWDNGDGYVAWALVTYRGQRICAETSICSCHPDAEAS